MSHLPVCRIAAVAISCLSAAPGIPARAGDTGSWRVVEIAAPGAVAEIVQAGASAAIRIGRTWYRGATCPAGLCLAVSSAPPRQRPPRGGLADGWIARAPGPGIVEAWYDEPTGRYDHAILGDAVEAGALVARDAAGTRFRLRLPADQVFEDLTPRIADIDGDGRGDIVAIRSFLDRGASLVVYGIVGGRLRLRASSPPIGRAHRWLNIAGIADFDGDGSRDMAVVATPHIGGTLEFWSWQAGGLERTASAAGFSNHAIGSRALGLSAVVDVDGDGRPDLVLPDTRRRAVLIVRVEAGRIETIARVPLPGAIIHDIATVPTAEGVAFVAGLDSGRLVAILP